MKSDFMVKTAKIVEEVSARACVDKIDTEVIETILQASLNEYCTMVDEQVRQGNYRHLICDSWVTDWREPN